MQSNELETLMNGHRECNRFQSRKFVFAFFAIELKENFKIKNELIFTV